MTARIVPPLLQSLARHRAVAGLLALQVALATAACANTFAMLAGDVAAMHEPSGMDESGLLVLPMATDGSSAPEEAMSRLRAIPGVRGVAALGGTPFGIDITSHAARDASGADGVAASQYQATRGAVATLGLSIVAGRDFTAGDFPDGGGPAGEDGVPAGTAIVSRALARRLYGSERAALGQALYLDDAPLHIVGVVAHLLRGQPSADAGRDGNGLAVLLPRAPDPHLGAYMLRVDPADARRIATDAAAALPVANGLPEAPATLADARATHFAKARADVRLLLAATASFLAITAIGIFGMSFFWVRRRTSTLGIRRALGTSRFALVRGLLLENAVVVAAGNTLGVACALAANRWLAANAGAAPLPTLHLSTAVAATWLVAAGAALLPALRAASLSPAHALRFP